MSTHSATPKTTLSLRLSDEGATRALGAALAACLRPGDVAALRGDLGVGKTALARAYLRARTGDPDEDVPSPTFTLVQTYDGSDGGAIWHFDLYRLGRPEDAWELGIEDAFAKAVSLIEWPERLGTLLPRNHLTVEMTFADDAHPEARNVRLIGKGLDWKARLGQLRDQLGGGTLESA